MLETRGPYLKASLGWSTLRRSTKSAVARESNCIHEVTINSSFVNVSTWGNHVSIKILGYLDGLRGEEETACPRN